MYLDINDEFKCWFVPVHFGMYTLAGKSNFQLGVGYHQVLPVRERNTNYYNSTHFFPAVF